MDNSSILRWHYIRSLRREEESTRLYYFLVSLLCQIK